MDRDIALGIDLGTSTSCIAIVEDGVAKVIPNAWGERIQASVVAFLSDGRVRVGNDAKDKIILDPPNTVYSAKRLIGRFYHSQEVKQAKTLMPYEIVEGPNGSVRIRIMNEDYSLPEIQALILRELKSVAEDYLGDSVSKCVITVPAYFNDNQRQATKDTGRIAGLDVLRIINEPTAAALAYGYGKNLEQRVAVYDLGGGTFDISILELGKDTYEVLSTAGDTYLGGDDFDARLMDHMADRFLAKTGINLRSDKHAMQKLKDAAERGKKVFSERDAVRIEIPNICQDQDGKPLELVSEISSTEFNRMVMDLVQRTFKVCDEAMRGAGLTVGELDGIILVGGPTRLPVIRESVKGYFGRDPQLGIDPDEVVAMGAAIQAASLISPEQNTYLLDVTPLSLQLGTVGGYCEKIIEKNTPIPIDQTRTFSPAKDYQDKVKIRIYQGESNRGEENELLGEFEFSGFRPSVRGEVAIEVTFEIDTDGVVNVTARDVQTGQRQSTVVRLSSGLSENELQSSIDRNQDFVFDEEIQM
ncbi:MAG: molecular chaperone DnaK [Deltaproteobacteria bacterium]|nr:molecular chaperone DnaK [Deltaproteobacteria bacterium]